MTRREELLEEIASVENSLDFLHQDVASCYSELDALERELEKLECGE